MEGLIPLTPLSSVRQFDNRNQNDVLAIASKIEVQP